MTDASACVPAVALLILGVVALQTPAHAAAEPQWIGPAGVEPGGKAVRFAGEMALKDKPTRALLRVAAWERYRLIVNGHGVSVGDTPWDAQTYDVTGLMAMGPNRVEVEARSTEAAPRNGWIWLRHDLPTAGSYRRLSFHTSGAREDEWIYVEVVDDKGNTSGLYCLETGHADLLLGSTGAGADHVIDLTTDRALDYRPHVGDRPLCDFRHIVTVRLRMDQKEALAHPSGVVAFDGVKLSGGGGAEADLSGPEGWRIEPGSGEHRRTSVVPGPDGRGFVLKYDFTPAADPKIAVDLRAWHGADEVGRLSSGLGWTAGGGPAAVVASPLDFVSWTPVSCAGPGDNTSPSVRALVEIDLSADRCHEGESAEVQTGVWSLDPMAGAPVTVRIEDWGGHRVFERAVPVAWRGAEGQVSLRTPKLTAGLYRVTATMPGAGPADRHAALAVLPAGATRVSSIFGRLTPIPSHPNLRGIDLNWGDSPSLLLGLRDLGVNFLQVHLDPHQLDNGEFDELLAFCKATKMHFALNNENANWVAESKAPDGHDRFVAPGGCHRWDIEAPALDRAAATGLFEGVVYDEGEHMQLCRNFYADLPDRDHRRPYLVETTGMTLPQAREAFEQAAAGVAAYNRQHGGRMIVESVFPVLWHPLAQAGVTLCPKLLKEDIHPVVLAMALGAAKEYGTDLWFSPDLWWLDKFPGHSVEEYAAALRLAHAAGVDNVYTEAMVALCRQRGASYELTRYGLALREFHSDYVPAHPRGYTYRDYEPEVAIIRFPDSDWGQGSSYYWKTLYGAENLPPTAETGEWLQVWALLTGGTTDPRAVNANSEVYRERGWRFTYPSAPVAVYDHLVGEGPLRSVTTLFLCGIEVSEKTLSAVRQRVRDGAACFSTARLLPPDVRARVGDLPCRIQEGKGAWIVVAGFKPDELGAYRSLLPKPGDAMRLRFKGREVVPQ
jgi:hypothetical protein